MNKQRVRPILLQILLMVSVAAVMPLLTLAQTKAGIELCNAWEFQKAETVLREAVKANPDDIQARYYLGLSVLMQDKHSEALELFRKVEEQRNKAGKTGPTVPDEYQIRIALAHAQLELKHNDEAWKNLETARKLHADGVEVHIYRGLYYMNTEDLHKAIDELEKAIRIDEKNAYAHYYAGHAHLRHGNPAKAVEMLKIFLELAPQAPEAIKAKALIDALC